jgi:hypothetical protein
LAALESIHANDPEHRIGAMKHFRMKLANIREISGALRSSISSTGLPQPDIG